MEGEISGVPRWYKSPAVTVVVDALRFVVRPATLLVLTVLLVLAFVVFPLAFMEIYRDRPIPGVRVLGEPVGGAEAASAKLAIERVAMRYQSAPLVLEAGGQRWQVSLSEIGIRIDTEATLSEIVALGKGEFPAKAGLLAVGTWLWGLEHPAVLRVDDTRLHSFLETVAARIRVPARDAGLAVKGGRVARLVDQPGVHLDLEGAKRAILSAVARGRSGEVSLPLTMEPPRLDWHTVAPYEEKLAAALEGTVLLTAGSYGQMLVGEQLWRLVRGTAYDPSAPDGIGLELDREAASSLVASLQLRVGTPARDASISVSHDGQATVEPERVGLGVTAEGLARALSDALLRDVPVAKVPIEPVAYPVVKAEDLAAAAAEAEAILSRGVTLFYGDQSWDLGRRDLAKALVFSGAGRGTHPKVDRDRLSEVIAGIPFGIEEPGRIEKVAWWGGPVVTGRAVDAQATAQAVVQALSEGRHFVELRFRPSLPDLPKAQVPAEKPGKWIDINLSAQTLVAYEGDVPVYYTLVSTGRPGHATPTGTFRVYIKLVKDNMSNGTFGVSPDDPDYYNLKDVPYVMYFLSGGYAIHGTYWHNNFGHVMSHGCVNAPTPAARWLFGWAELGTPVVIHY